MIRISITTVLCFTIGVSPLFADKSIVTEKEDYYGRKKTKVDGKTPLDGSK